MNTADIPPHLNAVHRSSTPRTAALTVVALVAVWATVLVGSLFWVGGAIFTMWAILGIRSGETLPIAPLRCTDQPVLFGRVSLGWLAIGVLWIIFPR